MDPLNGRDDDTESDPDVRIGSLVDDRYKILEAMASGAMGAVYKAERVPVGKLVAIKFLHASYAKDAEFLARFERETRVMSKLAHPNCVSVVDFGVWEGAPYLVMEYVAGVTLRAMIDDAVIPAERALRLIRQVAAGLAHAHSQGVVHRDVKPANIMISQEVGTGDHVRILDFGLARLRGNVGRDATQANVVVGTPNYMAPEQTIGGGTIDARTDIYAVGVVLFEMIAGVRPFVADDTMQLLGMHRGAPVPKLEAKAEPGTEIPPGLQELVEKAMAKLPDERYQTAIELAEAIDEIVGPRRTGQQETVKPSKIDPAAVAPTLIDPASNKATKPPPPKRRSSAGGLGFLVVILAGGAVAAWYVKMRPQQDQPIDGSVMIASGGSGGSSGSSGGALVEGSDASPGSGSGNVEIMAFAMNDANAPDVAELGSGGSATVGSAGSAAVGSAGSGSAADEIEMDPEAATNPDPNADNETAEDEAADAPETTEDAEKRAPAEPVLASTVGEAIQLIKDGKRELALASLNALWKKSPNRADIPFLLGNLYNDKLWWSVAMDHYKAAINKNGRYRGNPVLNRNVIRMLASPKTDKKASAFLRTTIGKPAIGYLKAAAKTEKNDRVRNKAKALASSIR